MHWYGNCSPTTKRPKLFFVYLERATLNEISAAELTQLTGMQFEAAESAAKGERVESPGANALKFLLNVSPRHPPHVDVINL